MMNQNITPEDFNALGRVYCKYCFDTHYFDITKVSSLAYEDEFFLNFDYKNKDFWLRDRWSDRKRLLDLAQLKETIEGVSCDIYQVREIVKILPESIQEPIDLKWTDVDEFLALATIFESSELIVTLELYKAEANSEKLWFESVNFCYKLPVDYTKKQLRRDYLQYLFHNRATPFYTCDVFLTLEEAKRLRNALKYISNEVSLRRDSKYDYWWNGEKPPGET